MYEHWEERAFWPPEDFIASECPAHSVDNWVVEYNGILAKQ